MCACVEEGREKEWEGGEDREMSVKRRRRRQRKAVLIMKKARVISQALQF
jgi:hypothetical protein